MASRPTVLPSISSPPTTPKPVAAARRRKRGTNEEDQNVRYFLLKPGSSLEKPELGEEVSSLKQVLIRSFKTGHPFLALTAWSAVEDNSEGSGDSPTIVKQGVARS